MTPKSVRPKLGSSVAKGGTPTLTAAEYRKLRQPKGRSWVPRSPPEARRVGGVTFSSQAEAKRYVELLRLEGTGEVRFFILQPTFLVLGCKVRADFLIVWAHGGVTVEDVEGSWVHPAHRQRKERNRRQVFEAHGVQIESVIR